jgi:valyl-tRNA synthetase
MPSPRSTNTRDIQISKGKHKTINNRSQNMWASAELHSPTTASPEYTKTPTNQESVLKSYLMKAIESLKEDINNSLKNYRKTQTGEGIE